MSATSRPSRLSTLAVGRRRVDYVVPSASSVVSDRGLTVPTRASARCADTPCACGLDAIQRLIEPWDRLPPRRVVVRFEFPDVAPQVEQSSGSSFDQERPEVCRTDPGFEEDLVVTAQALP